MKNGSVRTFDQYIYIPTGILFSMFTNATCLLCCDHHCHLRLLSALLVKNFQIPMSFYISLVKMRPILCRCFFFSSPAPKVRVSYFHRATAAVRPFVVVCPRPPPVRPIFLRICLFFSRTA